MEEVERIVIDGDKVYREEPHICYKPGTGHVILGYDRYQVMDKATFLKMYERWVIGGDDRK